MQTYEKTFREYMQAIWSRRWIVAAFFVICLSTVVMATFLMTPLYKASAKCLIEGERSNVLSFEASTTVGTDVRLYESYLETQIELIKSKAVAGRVYREMELGSTERYAPKMGLMKFFGNSFIKDIEIKRIPDTRMITISAKHPDAEVAATIANRLAETYAENNLTRRALNFIRNQRMAALNAEFMRLQSKLDELSTRYGPKHPEMIRLKDEIRMMSKRIRDERFSADVLTDDEIFQEDQILLEEVLLQIQESSVVSSSQVENIVIVDAASAPLRPSIPNIPINIAIGALVALVGGICLALFIDYLDDSIKSDKDLKRIVGEKLFLGEVPWYKKKVFRMPSKLSHMDCMVVTDSESPASESYRLIRIALGWHAEKNGHIRDIGILSSLPGEGKTTMASNIAAAFSQIMERVLLVDTDIRRGRIHKAYGLKGNKGLANYLTDEISLDETIQKTNIEPLDVVVAGKSHLSPSQLLSSAKMQQFIKDMRERYQIIIYDTPPITLISDSALLISQLDGTVLTVRSGMTGARLLPKTMSMIADANTRLIGVVLNGAQIENKYYQKYYRN